ncbi:MAG TPA: PilZ domain-containing protein [Kofleriaceae bacterium]
MSEFLGAEVREREIAFYIRRQYLTVDYMDKREAVRVPVQMHARCRAFGVVIDGLVEDVSRSGLFMRAPRHIRPGSFTELDLDLPGESTIHLPAEVVRVEQSPRSGMALRFTAVAPQAKAPLANFIMKQHANVIG